MYEKLRNDFISLLPIDTPKEYMEQALKALDIAAVNYEITEKETALIPYSFGLPELVKKYLVCKHLEGLSDGSLENYKLILEKFFEKVCKLPEKVTTDDIRYWLYWYQTQHNISDRTLDKYRMYVCGFFTWATAEKIFFTKSRRFN